MMASGLVVVMLAWLSACQSATVSIGAVDAQVPILVGPVLLLGNAPHASPQVGARFSGRVSAVMTEVQRGEDADKLASDFVERMDQSDELTPAIRGAVSALTGKALYLERIHLVDAVHWTALFFVDKRLEVEGYAFGLPPQRPVGE